jgi:hypothetical protein
MEKEGDNEGFAIHVAVVVDAIVVISEEAAIRKWKKDAVTAAARVLSGPPSVGLAGT